jgi:hypothetical protein
MNITLGEIDITLGDNDITLGDNDIYVYNTCALSKHIGNTHIYLYASTVHMYCIYPAILNRK